MAARRIRGGGGRRRAPPQSGDPVLRPVQLDRALSRSISPDPEVYAELVLAVRKIVRESVARHGGEVVRVDGDGLLCIFGYPECHEDAGRRAGEAAIDAHAAVAALDRRVAGRSVPLRLHSGIHTGLVLLRDGDIECGRYEMLCDTTNVAAGLCKQSDGDEILVSEATLGADRHFFRLGPRRRIGSARARTGSWCPA